VNGPVTGEPEARRVPLSDPDGASQRLPGRNDLAPVVVATMAADVMRTLGLAAVRAFGVSFVRQRLMAATHAGT
jgi:hypothetical protein